MSKSASALAKKLLKRNRDSLGEVRIHEFPDDESAHDDELTERLYIDFSDEFERVQTELTKQFGAPSRTGATDDEAIPLNGVFRFAVWDVGNKQLFAAATHEDRGVPIILMLGTK
jgi:hypothetical protein